MKNTANVTLTLTQEELLLTHAALCEKRARLGELISRMTQFDLNTDEAQVLSNQIGALIWRIGAEIHS